MIIQRMSRVVMVAAMILPLAACDSIVTGTSSGTGVTMDSSIPGTNLEKPPYVVTTPVCEIVERPGYFTYAGLVFKFLNTSNKIVDKMTVTFMLFDAATKGNPFIGSNVFQLTKLDQVLSNENKEICISLDRYIYRAPSEPFLIDYFYIAEVHYTDGSTWTDHNGIFR